MVELVHGNIFSTECNVITNQVNCQGIMGRHGNITNLAYQIRAKYNSAYLRYKKYCNENKHNKGAMLGKCQLLKVQPNKYIANLFSQLDIGMDDIQTSYPALITALNSLHELAFTNDSGLLSIALPYKLGCNRGGGDWNIIHRLIYDEFGTSPIVVKIYKLKNTQNKVVW